MNHFSSWPGFKKYSLLQTGFLWWSCERLPPYCITKVKNIPFIFYSPTPPHKLLFFLSISGLCDLKATSELQVALVETIIAVEWIPLPRPIRPLMKPQFHKIHISPWNMPDSFHLKKKLNRFFPEPFQIVCKFEKYLRVKYKIKALHTQIPLDWAQHTLSCAGMWWFASCHRNEIIHLFSVKVWDWLRQSLLISPVCSVVSLCAGVTDI